MTSGLPATLHELSTALGGVELRLEVTGAADARHVRRELMAQIDDYLVPRLEQMEAPLLMVVGGSTGAGKSTLVNSLVGEAVSPAGVLRPTTRAPVLVCHPDDVGWFADDRILPGLARQMGGEGDAGGLRVVPAPALRPGLALLDAPDIDSVVEANRDLSRQLLAAADAWLFVTTASRYADAVPWELLQAARERGTALSLVLNRVPDGADAEITPHLRQMLAERGLPDTEILVVPEAALVDGRLPEPALAPVRGFFGVLLAEGGARADLVRRTLTGALESIPARVHAVLEASAEQAAAAEQLRADVTRAYERALREIDESVRDGSLLRGEVLARWHDVVGTGDVMRALEGGIGRLRDRVRSFLTGSAAPDAELKVAVQSSVDAMVHSAADRAAEEAAESWRSRPPGRPLLAGERLDRASPGLPGATADEVRRWQGHVFDLVASEGAAKRSSARLASLGVNGTGLVVMLAVFLQTGGLTGAEVAVAGGSSALGHKLLEAILGDQAVRALAARAREDLLERVSRLLDGEAARFEERLAAAAPDVDELARLRSALEAVQGAR